MVTSLKHLTDFRQALCRIANGELNDKTFGICYNADMLSSVNAYSMVSYFSTSWSGYSGSPEYPVKENREFGKWQGPNLGARLSLIQHIITELDKYIEDYQHDEQNP